MFAVASSPLAEALLTPAVSSGVDFVWAVSLGQIMTIGVFVLTLVATTGKIYQTVTNLKRQHEKFDIEVSEIKRNAEELRKEHREDARELRGVINNLNQTLMSFKSVEDRAALASSKRRDNDGPALPE